MGSEVADAEDRTLERLPSGGGGEAGGRGEASPRTVRLAPTILRYLGGGLAVNCLVALLVLEAVQGIVFTVRATEGYSFDFLLIFPVLLRAFGQALVYTLPISLLFGTGFLVGRLNADREVTALRGFGVSPEHLALPAVGIGLAAALLAVVLNHEVVPRLRFANRNVGSLILEHLGYLGEGWNLGYRSGARSIWIHHYDGPLLEGIFFSVSGEGEGAPFSKKTLQRVDAPAYPLYLLAERAWARRERTGEVQGAVVELRGVRAFFSHALIAPGEPSEFMDLVRMDAYALPLPFAAKEPSVKDMPSPDLRREIGRRRAACREAPWTGGARPLYEGYAAALTEFHRRYAHAATAFTFPVAAFLIGLSLRSRNRLLPFFLASAICPAVYFSFVEVGPELATRLWAPAGEPGILGPWWAVHAGNVLLLAVSAMLWIRLRLGPR